MATRKHVGVKRPAPNSKLAPRATAPKPARVVSAQKTEERVWNLTDDPSKGGGGHVLMLVGKNVAPGKAVRVPLEMIEKAKRLRSMEQSGLVHIGPTPPRSYLEAKNRAKAVVPKTNARSHGFVVEKRKVIDARKLALASLEETKKAAAKLASAEDALSKDRDNALLKSQVAAAKDAHGRLKKVSDGAVAALDAAKKELASKIPSPPLKKAADKKVSDSAETVKRDDKKRGK